MFLRRWLLPVSLALILFAGVILGSAILKEKYLYLFQKYAWYSRGHIVADREVLGNYFDRYGGKSLVEFAISTSQKETRANGHYVGHAVGEVLYEKEKLAAVVDCGESFEFGCLHQVLGKALAEQGPGALKSLTEMCAAYPTADERGQCQHGLGHGIMYESGYKPSSIESLLDRCDQITTTRPTHYTKSCQAGLMMEFNEHYMTMEYEGLNGRPASTTRPFAFCDEVSSGAHRRMCVWWAVPWLHGRLYSFDYSAKTFEALGKLCQSVGDPNLQQLCYRAIGRQVGINGDLPAPLSLKYCLAVSPEKIKQHYCIENAAGIYADAKNPSEGRKLCSAVEQDSQLACKNVKNLGIVDGKYQEDALRDIQ